MANIKLRSDFFQCMREFENEIVHLKVSAGLDFPSSEVIITEQEDHIEFELNFMGLYGVDSPLPHYFLDICSQENEQAELLKKLIDVIHNRLYRLLYAAWKKHKPLIQFEKNDKSYLRYLSAIAGQSLEAHDGLYEYAGLFKSIPNAHLLLNLLKHKLPNVPVTLKQNMPDWEKLLTISKLGSTGLGDDSVLGDSILVSHKRIQITIGPIKIYDLYHFLQTQADYLNFIKNEIGFYYRIEFIFLVTDVFTHTLSKDSFSAKLGWNCLGHSKVAWILSS
ncbi:MAG: type VI secretion system baseplate subunit TssG [Proteobacteria bacterium]|nr:type VI secretion system baseplate subunit TssG [Pseudomonadota bacterium]